MNRSTWKPVLKGIGLLMMALALFGAAIAFIAWGIQSLIGD